MKVLDRIRRDLRRLGLIGKDVAVAAAVSGGSDSVALAHALARIAADGDLRFAGIVHFDHQLRDTSKDDETHARALAETLGVRFVSGCGDVRSRAAEERRSVEDAARRARYEFFARARAALNAEAVALGHTRDDQAETLLLRLLRGAGSRGLAAMYPRNGIVIRPLLACRRAELREWLTDLAARGTAGTAFVEDETNADVAIPRNRVRAELMPLLESRFNEDIVDVLADEADLARDSWAIIEPVAARTPIDVERLRSVEPAIARVALWRAMTLAAGGREVGYRHVSAALDLVLEDGDRSIDVPGHRVERIGSRIVLVSRPVDRRGREHETEESAAFRFSLPIPGEVTLSDGSVTAEAVEAPGPAGLGALATTGRGSTALVRADLCDGLAVRNRVPGDRFRPVGLGGSKKLQDLFVDRKVARAERSRVPVVVDGSDRIVWVAGHGIDEAFAVTDAAQAVLLLRLTRP